MTWHTMPSRTLASIGDGPVMEERMGHYQSIAHECPLGCCISLDFVLANRKFDLEFPEPPWWRPLRRAYWRGMRDLAADVLDDAGK